MDRHLIIDFQGFRDNRHEYVIKELAYVKLKGNNHVSNYCFLAPIAFETLLPHIKRENRWIEKHLLHLSWYSGRTPYSSLQNVLYGATKDITHLYVKGIEKVSYLKKILHDLHKHPNINVINLEEYDCPKLKELRKRYNFRLCKYSHSTHNCAETNVQCLKQWMMEYMFF